MNRSALLGAAKRGPKRQTLPFPQPRVFHRDSEKVKKIQSTRRLSYYYHVTFSTFLGSFTLERERKFQHYFRHCRRISSFNSNDDNTGNNHNVNVNNSNPPHYDPYERFRHHAITDQIWQEIQAENEQTRRSGIDPSLYDRVLDEMLEAARRIPPSPPEVGPTGKYAYSFQEEKENHSTRRIYQRQSTCSTASNYGTIPQQVLFDLPIDDTLVAMSLSVDESVIAYLREEPSTPTTPKDTNECKQGKVMVRHIDSGTETEILLPTNGCDMSSIEFGPAITTEDGGKQNHSLFYVTNDSQGRPFAAWSCVVECSYRANDTTTVLRLSKQYDPVLLKEFQDCAVVVNLQRTKGCHYVAIQANTKSSSEVYLCRDVCNTDPKLTLVAPRQGGVVYHLDVGREDDVYMLISRTNPSVSRNDNTTTSPSPSLLGLEYSLWKTTMDHLPLPELSTNSKNIKNGIFVSGAQTGFVITDMDIFEDFVALYERSTKDGQQRLRLIGKENSNKETIVPLASSLEEEQKCIKLSACGNMFYCSKSIRFQVESPACPPRIYEYDVGTNKLNQIAGEPFEVRHGMFRHERVLVPSNDGTEVPLSLVFREKSPAKKQNTARAILMGYGSYGEVLDLAFDPSLQPLLHRGFVLAYAHTRGGGDLGRNWYYRGLLYNKPRVVEDYVACAQALSKTHRITAKVSCR